MTTGCTNITDACDVWDGGDGPATNGFTADELNDQCCFFFCIKWSCLFKLAVILEVASAVCIVVAAVLPAIYFMCRSRGYFPSSLFNKVADFKYRQTLQNDFTRETIIYSDRMGLAMVYYPVGIGLLLKLIEITNQARVTAACVRLACC